MRSLRILLVEDDAIVSALIVELLADMGHEVCATARTELEAVAAAEQCAPDLMIVDAILRMGGGVAAMATILRRTPMPHIFMTAGARQTIPARAVLLQKPFGTAGLTGAIERVASQIPALAQQAPEA